MDINLRSYDLLRLSFLSGFHTRWIFPHQRELPLLQMIRKRTLSISLESINNRLDTSLLSSDLSKNLNHIKERVYDMLENTYAERQVRPEVRNNKAERWKNKAKRIKNFSLLSTFNFKLSTLNFKLTHSYVRQGT